VLPAVFIEVLNVDHAVFTLVRTALVVVPVYAVASAVARALYAEFTAEPCAVIAVSIADSRVATAAPTHAIVVATEAEDTPVPFMCVSVPVAVPVSANAGTASKSPRANVPIAIVLCDIFSKIN
jgi:hypothetical protein